MHRKRSGVRAVYIETLEQRWLLSNVVFTVDPSRSSLTLGGNVVGVELSPQIAGSLTDSFSGSINASVANSAIEFSSANITAATGGSALPGGQAANFGGEEVVDGNVESDIALRGLAFNLTSNLAIPVSGGNLSTIDEYFTPTAGVADYSGSQNVSTNLNTIATTPDTALQSSTLQISGGVATLTIPVTAVAEITLESADDSVLSFMGQIVATASVPTATLSNGVLTIQGTMGQDDIQLGLNGSKINVNFFGITTQTFKVSKVSSIVINGAAGADEIRVSAGLPPAALNAGKGADTLIAHSADDSLNGAMGNDSLQSTGGHSDLGAGQGNDQLSVTGNENQILGGAGDDVITAPSASGAGDTIDGGPGNDTAFANSMLDTITNVEQINAD